MKKLSLITIGVAVVLACLFAVTKGFKGSQSDGVPLTQALQNTLPKEAQDKVLINQDKVNLGKQYISTIYITQDDTKAAEIVSNFVYEAYSRKDNEEMKDMSAVNIVIYKDHEDKTKARQYRVLLGSNIASRQNPEFWQSKDSKALFKWLTAECPKTSSANLMDFCDISSSLKEQ